MDQHNKAGLNTTIVGLPTLMAQIAGRQDPAPIVAALTAGGYPQEDISVLFRPTGTDSVEDLLSGETAAGQDHDAAAKSKGDGDGDTLILLHPEKEQLDAVRKALNALGIEECEYEGKTIYTGDNAEADVAAALGANVSSTNPVHAQAAGRGEPGRSPADRDRASQVTASSSATSEPAHLTGSTGPGYGDIQEGPSATPQDDNSDLKAQIGALKEQVEDVREDLKERD